MQPRRGNPSHHRHGFVHRLRPVVHGPAPADGGLKIVDGSPVTATSQEHHPRTTPSHHGLWGGPQWTAGVVNRTERGGNGTRCAQREVVFHPRMPKQQVHLEHLTACFSATANGVQAQRLARCLHTTLQHHAVQSVRPSMPF
ncbi:MAG: hypothetical protein VYB36_00650 [Candidatus Thermoplasmatota archaeon]|nr:hypothetical protein [Candidatus Thermoplasmatota archaeon]